MLGMMRTPADSRWYRLTIGSLIVAAWVVLLIWGASPFARLLSHEELGEGEFPLAFTLTVFVAGWTLMIIAMMLPSSLPLLNLFRRMTLNRPDGKRLLGLLLLGYLGVWTAFGGLAYLGDSLLHETVENLPSSTGISLGLVIGILLAAGAYQFTPLKHMCLEKCRSPYSFLVENWRGQGASLEAFRLGLRHGLFCLGCCWTLMLLMFAVGGANLGWMLALGAIMTAERVSRWGRYLTRPLGLALILWAVLYLAGYLPSPIT
jgi:predicted metal-binding membrane protein